ncbi:unnamed protein product [Thelazia callipaeda]|uniref:Uncharacterized protein n=1 Tax=Thelazia callipaeda TaxID=103827 RepID=A0A0N5DCB5_THECL|nr:unnamed protein product [Thelazia callipaeda]
MDQIYAYEKYLKNRYSKIEIFYFFNGTCEFLFAVSVNNWQSLQESLDTGGEGTLTSGSDHSKKSRKEGRYKSLEKIRSPPLFPRNTNDPATFSPLSQRRNYVEVNLVNLSLQFAYCIKIIQSKLRIL